MPAGRGGRPDDETPGPPVDDAATASLTGVAHAARARLGGDRLSRVLQRVLGHARLANGCDAAGITVVSGRRLATLADTSPAVGQADRLQMVHDEGPALEPQVAGAAFLVADLGHGERWRHWGPAAAGLGWGSLLSVHLDVPPASRGTLNLYACHADAFDREDVELTEALAVTVSTAIAETRSRAEAGRSGLSRGVIDQAQSELVDRYALDPQEAFAVLTHYANLTKTPLRDVAEHILSTHRAPG